MFETGIFLVKKPFRLSLTLHTWKEGQEYGYKIENGILYIESDSIPKGKFLKIDETKEELENYVEFK